MSNDLEICVSLYGMEKITLLYALLASITKVYEGDNSVSINLLVQDISESVIKEIKRKVNLDLRVVRYENPIGRDRISGKMNLWKRLVDSSTKDNILLLDADTVLVRDVRPFFDKNFSIGFTYKTDEDENLAWPINTGVILVKNNSSSKLFFHKWVNLTGDFVRDCKNEDRRLEGWGALDQAAFGFLVGVRTPESFGRGQCVDECFVQGFPCSALNETRCKSLENCYVIHYKGFAQKMVLSGHYNQWRPQDKCECMKDYWDELVKYWKSL